jgi:hypothetical protein
MTETWVYEDSETIKIAGDVTSKYWVNQIIRIVQGSATKFFLINSLSYENDYTYLYVSGGGLYEVANEAISAHYVTSYAAPTNPAMDFGFLVLAILNSSYSWETAFDMNDTAESDNSAYAIKYVGGRFDASKLMGYQGIFFEADLYLASASTDTVYAELCDTGGSVIEGSEISKELAQYEHGIVRSGDLSDVIADNPIALAIKSKSANGGTYQIVRPRIVVRYGPPWIAPS